MNQLIHGHEVMEFIITSGKLFSKSSLKQAIIDKFGSQTRFYTCSAHDLTAQELIDFLESKGKFFYSGDGFTTDESKICSHGHV